MISGYIRHTDVATLYIQVKYLEWCAPIFKNQIFVVGLVGLTVLTAIYGYCCGKSRDETGLEDLKEQLDEKKPGLMKIDTDKFRILGGHGYYFPKWELAKDLLDRMNQKEKMRALDTEMVKLQRQGIIKYFYYPALTYLNMEDAKKGVHSGYIHRDMKHYG